MTPSPKQKQAAAIGTIILVLVAVVVLAVVFQPWTWVGIGKSKPQAKPAVVKAVPPDDTTEQAPVDTGKVTQQPTPLTPQPAPTDSTLAKILKGIEALQKADSLATAKQTAFADSVRKGLIGQVAQPAPTTPPATIAPMDSSTWKAIEEVGRTRRPAKH